MILGQPFHLSATVDAARAIGFFNGFPLCSRQIEKRGILFPCTSSLPLGGNFVRICFAPTFILSTPLFLVRSFVFLRGLLYLRRVIDGIYCLFLSKLFPTGLAIPSRILQSNVMLLSVGSTPTLKESFSVPQFVATLVTLLENLLSWSKYPFHKDIIAYLRSFGSTMVRAMQPIQGMAAA